MDMSVEGKPPLPELALTKSGVLVQRSKGLVRFFTETLGGRQALSAKTIGRITEGSFKNMTATSEGMALASSLIGHLSRLEEEIDTPSLDAVLLRLKHALNKLPIPIFAIPAHELAQPYVQNLTQIDQMKQRLRILQCTTLLNSTDLQKVEEGKRLVKERFPQYFDPKTGQLSATFLRRRVRLDRGR